MSNKNTNKNTNKNDSQVIVAAHLEETSVVAAGTLLICEIQDGVIQSSRLTREGKTECSCPTYKANETFAGNATPTCPHVRLSSAAKVYEACLLVKGKVLGVTSECKLALSTLIPRVLSVGGSTALPPGVILHDETADGVALTAKVTTPVLRSYALTMLAASTEGKPLGRAEVLSPDGTLDDAVETRLLLVAENIVKTKVPVEKQKAAKPDSLSQIMASFKFPPKEVFYISEPLKRQLVFAVTQGQHLLLCGPSGSGKTEVLRHTATAAGMKLVAFNLGAMSEARTSLIGSMTLVGGQTKFVRSKFIEAISTPNTMVLLDELSRAPSDAFNILLPVLDGQRTVSIDEEGGTEINIAEGVVFVATANIGMEYTGTGTLDRALKDRFMIEHVEYPPAAEEAAVIAKRCGCPMRTANLLVRLAGDQRARAEKDEEFSIVVSTRMLLLAARQMVFQIPPHEAINRCIESFFSAEGGTDSERAKVNQIARKYFPIAREGASEQ